MGVAHVALDGRWVEVNDRLCQIVGYAREELQSKTFQDITYPADLANDLEYMRGLLAGEISSYTIDKRYLRKDGTVVWIGLTAALRRDAGGKPLYFISIIRDISARKEAQDHQAFLQHELAHRLKNQLAIIQAIAGQTARNAGSLKQFQEQFVQRLQGLAEGVNLLVDQGWTGAWLDVLVQRQLQAFIPGAARLISDGPSVTISPDSTQAIGLALHELATNAVKYGAWSNATGTVTVIWEIENEGTSTPQLIMTWQERGGPPMVPVARKGFGHVVIERMVAQKVNGTAELVFAPEGVCWTVKLTNAHFVHKKAVPAV